MEPIEKFIDPVYENAFQRWYKTIAKIKNLSSNPDDKEHYYDWRRYFKNKTVIQNFESLKYNGHFPDTYKLPGHPTFSNESVYTDKKNPGGEWVEVKPPYKNTGVKLKRKEAPIDYDELKLRQRFIESGFDDNKISSAGAIGRFQIMPSTWNEYTSITGNSGNLNNPEYNERVRDYYVEKRIPQMLKRNPASDSSRAAQIFGAYVQGAGAMNKDLDTLEKRGIDVNNSVNWVDSLKKNVVKNYINFIVRNKDIDKYINNQEYEKALKKHGLK